MSHTFSFERDIIDMGEEVVRDESWSFTDAQGHVHFWTSGTWKTVTADDYSWQECKLCGETVYPGVKYTGFRKYGAGQVHYYVNGQPVAPEDFMCPFEKEEA